MERLRAAVRSHADRTSLRQVAREIGMTRPGLQNFLDGGEPRPSTFQKLQSWYVRWSTHAGATMDLDTAMATVVIQTRDLPVGLRGRSAVQLVECLESIYDAASTSRPPWLEELRTQVTEETGEQEAP